MIVIFRTWNLSIRKSNIYYVCNIALFGAYFLSMKPFTLILACSFSISIHAQEKPSSTRTDTTILSGDSLVAVTVRTVVDKNRLITQPIGLEQLSLKETADLPVFMGERDILKTMQLLPGIKSAGDGNSGFYVRGGSSDQNLIMLDGTPVYNASHLLGFFSTFNGDAIKSLSFYKTAIPAQYGGRLSSVIDAATNDGDTGAYKVSGGIGLIAARFNVEGPIEKGKSSFLISGRRTYADLFARLSTDSSIRNNDLNFYDVNVKLNFTAGSRNEIGISAYAGNDVMRIGNSFGLKWGNRIAAVRWKHLFHTRLYGEGSLHYSNYDYTTTTLLADEPASIYSRIRDYSAKGELVFMPNARHEVRTGVQSTYHTMYPSVLTAGVRSGVNSQEQHRRYSLDNAIYVHHNWKPTDRLKLSYGLRFTSFSVLGGGDFYRTDGKGTITDTIATRRGEVVKSYLNAEPRIAAGYTLNKTSSFTIGYTRNIQHLHLVSNATAANPTDRWVASTNVVKPEIADQWNAGYSYKTDNRVYEFTVETYYKLLGNQIDYRNGVDIFSNDPIESKLLFGKGRAYGAEWLFKKKSGRLTGWIAYTLSKTERRINGVNNDQWYPAKQDRTHELSMVSTFRLSKKWVLSANWVYYTGNAVSFPAGKYIVRTDRLVYYYTSRNGYRMPDYHRLDIAATVQLHQTRRYHSTLHFGLYNAYGRANAYSMYFRESREHPDLTEAVQLTLFRFIPSVTYNFNF